MLFELIRKVFGLSRLNSSHNEEKTDKSPSEIDILEDRRKDAIYAKNSIRKISIDWYNLTPKKDKSSSKISIFVRYNLSNIPTLKFLKEERLRKEKERLIELETKIKKDLLEIKSLILREKLNEANQVLRKVQANIPLINNSQILIQYREVQTSIQNLRNLLERKELQRFLEDKKINEEIARQKREDQERKQRELEQRLNEEKESKVKAAQIFTERARQKEMAAMAERQRLNSLCNEKKANFKDFKNVLIKNGITYLFHFTEKRNIPSIKRHGGLYSWNYCDRHDIKISHPGGGKLSRDLDMRYGLQDYVRLSFCREHPMQYVAIKDGRIQDPVILLINTEVAYLKDTLFSNMNATKTGHLKGGSLEDLNRIKFEIVKQHNQFKLNELDRCYYQAEVLVKTWIPIKYIMNIDKL